MKLGTETSEILSGPVSYHFDTTKKERSDCLAYAGGREFPYVRFSFFPVNKAQQTALRPITDVCNISCGRRRYRAPPVSVSSVGAFTLRGENAFKRAAWQLRDICWDLKALSPL